MDAVLRGDAWDVWRRRRRRLNILGKCSACFFLLAFLALLDGVQELMRTDVHELTLLAGQEEGVSGPCPFQNPVKSDLLVHITPEDAPLSFELEGFFAGYLIGNGMWRGHVFAREQAATGTYELHIGFRGMLGTKERFLLHVFATEEDKRAASYSMVMRVLGLRAFVLAALLGCIAIVFGFSTLVLGRRNLALLGQLHFSEVFRSSPLKEAEQKIWCSAVGGEALRIGDELSVYAPSGQLVGQAALLQREKNVFCLRVVSNASLGAGLLVDLRSQRRSDEHTQSSYVHRVRLPRIERP